MKKRMKIKCPFIRVKSLLTLTLIYSLPSFAAPLSSEQIIQMIKEQDPVSVVRKLHKDNHGESWYNMLAQIKSGDAGWLRLPQLLEQGTGTKSAEQLMDAVTRAIPENPSGVLYILSEKNIYLNTMNICSLPLLPTNPVADEVLKTNALDVVKAQTGGTHCASIMQKAISAARKMSEKTL